MAQAIRVPRTLAGALEASTLSPCESDASSRQGTPACLARTVAVQALQNNVSPHASIISGFVSRAAAMRAMTSTWPRRRSASLLVANCEA